MPHEREIGRGQGERYLIPLLRKLVKCAHAGSLVWTGPPGLNKLSSKVLGNELDIRAQTLGLGRVPFFESFASNLDSVSALDDVVQSILDAGGGVWFIDELHALDANDATKIYSLMEDGRYPFHGTLQPTPVPNVQLIGATTEYGSLPAALKRRFGEPLLVRPMDREQLTTIVQKRAFGITHAATELLVDHTHWSGAPWESLILCREAETFARAEQRKEITEADVRDVFETYDIDPMGLRWEDRRVMTALFKRPNYRGKAQEFVCYGASESDVCVAAGLDPDEYRTAVKARLLSRGLIEIRRGYGQALTALGVERYAHLNPQVPAC